MLVRFKQHPEKYINDIFLGWFKRFKVKIDTIFEVVTDNGHSYYLTAIRGAPPLPNGGCVTFDKDVCEELPMKNITSLDEYM